MTAYSPKGMTEEERERLWNACDNIKLRMALECSYFFCMRPNEVLKIKKEHFKSGGFLLIPNQKNKFQNELYPIPHRFLPRLFAYLELFRNHIEENGGWLFWSNKRPGESMGLSGFCAMFRKARMKAGLDGEDYTFYVDKMGRRLNRVSPHAMKACRVREIYRKTESERKTQALAHHRSRQSTLRYLGNPVSDLDFKKSIVLELDKKDTKDKKRNPTIL